MYWAHSQSLELWPIKYVCQVSPSPTPAASSLPDWMTRQSSGHEWANELVKQLWPKCQSHLRQLLQQVEEDPNMKERLRGYNVRSVKFISASLGQVPPTLSGVKVTSSKTTSLDEIVVEVSKMLYVILHLHL